jgi:hypothetical protein
MAWAGMASKHTKVEPIRYRYVVSVVAQPGETRADIDQRLMETLDIRRGKTNVTLTGYNAIEGEFYKLEPD